VSVSSNKGMKAISSYAHLCALYGDASDRT